MALPSSDQPATDRALSPAGRLAAGAALAGAVLLTAYVLLSSGDTYTVRAHFISATQMIPGNIVRAAGRNVGKVVSVELTDDGQAELELEIDDPKLTPLREGTQAELRLQSLSSVVGRVVELRIPAGRGPPISSGGLIDVRHTTSAVSLDQLFSLFDPKTRKGLRGFIRGNARLYGGQGAAANAGFEYLNPALVGAARLFREVDYDSRILQDFLVSSSRLVTDVADRRDDLAQLIDRLATTTGAIAREQTSLSTAIARLPPFMRRANSTFVDLRATLDDIDPLVEESKPVAPRLRAVLRELRPFARDAVPTVRSLANLAGRAGDANDLLDLAKAIPPFRDIAVGTAERNGKQRPGSFPASTESLKGQQPIWAYFRPYTVDFTGWLDDFSHSGIYDANGSASRVATSVNAFAAVGSQLKLVPEGLRDELGNLVVARGQNNRCPGSMERPAPDKSNPWIPFKDFNCDPTQVPPGS